MLTKTPNGIAEINALFGDCNDPDFESKYIKSFPLPYPLHYAGQPVSRARCHYLIADNFIQAFQQIKDQGLMMQVVNYGGIYMVRPQRGASAKPSTHSWGIATDLEPEKYPLGSTARFSDEIVQIFKDAGFFYGGDFEKRLDPMHFQFCTGY